MTHVIQVSRYQVRMHVSSNDEANSNDKSKQAHEGRRDIIQSPCERNNPGPCNQNEGSGKAGQRGMRDGKRDASSRGISRNVLVVLCVDRCQNDSCAQRNRDASCAIDFALPLACWYTHG